MKHAIKQARLLAVGCLLACGESTSEPPAVSRDASLGLAITPASVSLMPGEGRVITVTVARASSDTTVWLVRNREVGDFGGRVVEVRSQAGRIVWSVPADSLTPQLAFARDTDRFVPLTPGRAGGVYLAAVDQSGRALPRGRYQASIALYAQALEGAGGQVVVPTVLRDVRVSLQFRVE